MVSKTCCFKSSFFSHCFWLFQTIGQNFDRCFLWKFLAIFRAQLFSQLFPLLLLNKTFCGLLILRIAQNAYCSRDIYLPWLTNYRSVILAVKRDLESFDWSKVTRAFLLREHCFSSLKVFKILYAIVRKKLHITCVCYKLDEQHWLVSFSTVLFVVLPRKSCCFLLLIPFCQFIVNRFFQHLLINVSAKHRSCAALLEEAELEKINIPAGVLKKVPPKPVEDKFSGQAEVISGISRKSQNIVSLGPDSLPSICFYSVLNAHSR